MAPLPDAWDEVAPNGCFDLFATPGSDPLPPFAVPARERQLSVG